MNVFEYYIAKHEDPNWVEEYQSTSDKKSGKTFLYTNTNFRTIYAFTDVFQKFLNYNNRPRDEWQTYDNGETMAKHWTVRMQQSKLFRLNNRKYSLTAKGEAFNALIDIEKNEGLNDNDLWVLIYYFVLNSYFGFRPNYIIERTNEVYAKLKNAGFATSDINSSFEYVLQRKDDITINELFRTDAFWILTFFKDSDFLSFYNLSSPQVKDLLFDRVTNQRIISDSTDLIGHKYKNSGQYNASMIIDDMFVLYVTHELLGKDNRDPLILLDNICSIVERLGRVDRHLLSSFLTEHYDVFEVIYNEVILNEDIDDQINEEDEEPESEEIDTSKIDETSILNRQILRNTRVILKRMAKDRANHKCELECLYSCRYFTSREDDDNYLEIHHLIPFAFSNEFENSLEHLDNYVALCPSCHMLLHHGTDRERKAALTYLFNQRKDKLKSAGLEITLDQLLSFYQVVE